MESTISIPEHMVGDSPLPASVARRFKISSIISCGILGTITVLTTTGAGRSSIEGLEPIRGVGRECRLELGNLGLVYM